MSIFIFFLLSLAFSLDFPTYQPPNCPKYVCGSPENPDTCFLGQFAGGQSKYFLQPCKEKNQVCEITAIFGVPGTCTEYYSKPTLLPGEACTHEKQCISGICEQKNPTDLNKVCIGYSIDKECLLDEECSEGLQCLNKVCKPLQPKGDQCSLSNKCKVSLVCDQGICTEIGSKKVGEKAEVPAACSTFFVKDHQCANGPVLKHEENSEGLRCPPSGECTYKFEEAKGEENEYKLPCSCGISEHNEGYCMPGRGDIVMDDVFFSRKLILYLSIYLIQNYLKLIPIVI